MCKWGGVCVWGGGGQGYILFMMHMYMDLHKTIAINYPLQAGYQATLMGY